MGLKDCLWCIGGASKGVSGCRFSLYPMTDKFVDIIRKNRYFKGLETDR